MSLEHKEGSKVSPKEDLREILELLKLDFRRLTSAIDFNHENPRKLAILVNSRQKITNSIFIGISLLRDPKLKLTTDSGRRVDLARMIQKTLLKNNPATKKMVEDLEQ